MWVGGYVRVRWPRSLRVQIFHEASASASRMKVLLLRGLGREPELPGALGREQKMKGDGGRKGGSSFFVLVAETLAT